MGPAVVVWTMPGGETRLVAMGKGVEIAYYLDRLDIIDETVAQGFEDQPLHRENFAAAIASLARRKDRLVRRQQELECRESIAVCAPLILMISTQLSVGNVWYCR